MIFFFQQGSNSNNSSGPSESELRAMEAARLGIPSHVMHTGIRFYPQLPSKSPKDSFSKLKVLMRFDGSC